MLPPRPFGRALLVRAAFTWVVLHVVMGVLPAVEGQLTFPGSFVGTPVAALWIAVATVALLWIAMWRKRELVFLANLGFAFRRMGALVAGECLLLEIALRLSLA